MVVNLDQVKEEHREPLFNYLLWLGDDRLILSHRLSEWCGHAPILEEDVALANIALDLLGQATILLNLAGKIEGKGRDEDQLAYLRDCTDFKSLKIVELPKGDFAFTIVRQVLFSIYSKLLFSKLSNSTFKPLQELSAKFLKEYAYHIRHSTQWLVRLGDGTETSRAKVINAIDSIWKYVNEFFINSPSDAVLIKENIAFNLEDLREDWEKEVKSYFQQAKDLPFPGKQKVVMPHSRKGFHTEYLGHLLAEMQFLQRAYPNSNW